MARSFHSSDGSVSSEWSRLGSVVEIPLSEQRASQLQRASVSRFSISFGDISRHIANAYRNSHWCSAQPSWHSPWQQRNTRSFDSVTTIETRDLFLSNHNWMQKILNGRATSFTLNSTYAKTVLFSRGNHSTQYYFGNNLLIGAMGVCWLPSFIATLKTLGRWHHHFHHGDLIATGHTPRLAEAALDAMGDEFTTLFNCFMASLASLLILAWLSQLIALFKKLDRQFTLINNTRDANELTTDQDLSDEARLELAYNLHPSEQAQSRMNNIPLGGFMLLGIFAALTTLLIISLHSYRQDVRHLSDDAVEDQRVTTQVLFLLKNMPSILVLLNLGQLLNHPLGRLHNHYRRTENATNHIENCWHYEARTNNHTVSIHHYKHSQPASLDTYALWGPLVCLTFTLFALLSMQVDYELFKSSIKEEVLNSSTITDDAVLQADWQWALFGIIFKWCNYVSLPLLFASSAASLGLAYYTDKHTDQVETFYFNHQRPQLMIPLGSTERQINAPYCHTAKGISAFITTAMSLTLGIMAACFYHQLKKETDAANQHSERILLGEYGWQLMIIPLMLFTSVSLAMACMLYSRGELNKLALERQGLYALVDIDNSSDVNLYRQAQNIKQTLWLPQKVSVRERVLTEEALLENLEQDPLKRAYFNLTQLAEVDFCQSNAWMTQFSAVLETLNDEISTCLQLLPLSEENGMLINSSTALAAQLAQRANLPAPDGQFNLALPQNAAPDYHNAWLSATIKSAQARARELKGVPTPRPSYSERAPQHDQYEVRISESKS